jgi:hypothetical protein
MEPIKNKRVIPERELPQFAHHVDQVVVSLPYGQQNQSSETSGVTVHEVQGEDLVNKLIAATATRTV